MAVDLLRQAESEVERLRGEGWTKNDVATELELFLNENKGRAH
jgi:hypothetical protein